MTRRLPSTYIFASIAVALSACGSYKQNVMFRVPQGAGLQRAVATAEQNYVIQHNDKLTLSVTTNKGETLIDPRGQIEDGTQTVAPEPPTYAVDVNGVARFPLVGDMKMEGLTLRQAEEILRKEFEKFYEDPFVSLQYTNKRAYVLGAPGGLVVPLTDENVQLIEVLALAKGVPPEGNATNIRIIRGTEVMLADLSTLEGVQSARMVVQPGDIIYIEPVSKPVSEALRDYGPVISIITSLTTLLVVVFGLN